MKGKQETVLIINPSRSVSVNRKFQQEIYKTLWEKKEVKLREQGWLLESEVKEVKIEKVEDGKGIKTIETVVEETVEETTTEAPADEEKKPVSRMNKAELQAECDSRGIEYHHASKRDKLIKLLSA